MKLQLLIEEKLEKPWWNRPLFGEKTLLNYIFNQSIRLNIPKEIVFFYNNALEKLESVTVTLKALLNDKFMEKDFLTYARLQSYLDKYSPPKKHYFLLGKDFFKVILNNLDTLIKLREIEIDYHSPIFKEYYQLCLNLIQQQQNKLIFQEKLKKLSQSIAIKLDDDQEKKVIKLYAKYLLIISEVNYLSTFFAEIKINQLEYWDLFKIIKAFIEDNNLSNIEDLKPFILLVKSYNNSLADIASKIIKIKKEEKENLLIIAGILQYVALSYKYETFYPQFQLFLNYLSKWEKSYYYLVNLKEKYPNTQYNYPANFNVKLPGFELYKTYYDYLDSTYSVKHKKRIDTD